MVEQNTLVRLFLVAALVGISASAAHANSGPYVGVNAMVGWSDATNPERHPPQPTETLLKVTSDTGGVSGGAGGWLGYEFRDLSVSLELSSTWRYRHDANITFRDTLIYDTFNAKVNMQTIDTMVSALWDLPVKGPSWLPVQPYVGGGVGAAHISMENYVLTPGKISAPDETQWNMAWQLQAGVKYPISNSTSFRVDYRYINLGEVDTTVFPTNARDSFSMDVDSHDIKIGVVWGF